MSQWESSVIAKLFAVCTLISAGALNTTIAVAQSTPAPGGKAPTQNSGGSENTYSKRQQTDAKGRKITIVDFDEAHIEGKAKAPDGFLLQSRGSGAFKNILELRRNFRSQMHSSSADVVELLPPTP